MSWWGRFLYPPWLCRWRALFFLLSAHWLNGKKNPSMDWNSAGATSNGWIWIHVWASWLCTIDRLVLQPACWVLPKQPVPLETLIIVFCRQERCGRGNPFLYFFHSVHWLKRICRFLSFWRSICLALKSFKFQICLGLHILFVSPYIFQYNIIIFVLLIT